MGNSRIQLTASAMNSRPPAPEKEFIYVERRAEEIWNGPRAHVFLLTLGRESMIHKHSLVFPGIRFKATWRYKLQVIHIIEPRFPFNVSVHSLCDLPSRELQSCWNRFKFPIYISEPSSKYSRRVERLRVPSGSGFHWITRSQRRNIDQSVYPLRSLQIWKFWNRWEIRPKIFVRMPDSILLSGALTYEQTF